MIKLPENLLRDEAEMRAFYESVGISREVTEAAIRARHNKPAEEASASLPKRKKRKAAAVAEK